jgi:spore germination cell wall hydrolase CwlJ-like protein
MILNKGLPNYDGKGKGSPKTNINAVSAELKKSMKSWEEKIPCFICGENGHTKESCKAPNISKCTIGECKKTHNQKAHGLMKAYLDAKEKKQKKKKNSNVNQSSTEAETGGDTKVAIPKATLNPTPPQNFD